MQLYDLMPYWSVVGGVLDRYLEHIPDGGEVHRPVPGFPTVRSLFVQMHLALTEAAGILGAGGSPAAPAGPAPASTEDARTAFGAAFAYIDGGLRQPVPSEPAVQRVVLRGLWSKLNKAIRARAHLKTHLYSLGVRVPPTRDPQSDTPAVDWPDGPVDAQVLFPRWPHLQRRYLRLIQGLAPEWLTFRLGGAGAALGDLLLHLLVQERLMVGVATGRHPGPEPITSAWFDVPPTALWETHGEGLAVPDGLIELWRRVRRTTLADLAGLTAGDLRRRVETPYGPASGHYVLWHALEHGLHHLAQAELLAAIARTAR